MSGPPFAHPTPPDLIFMLTSEADLVIRLPMHTSPLARIRARARRLSAGAWDMRI
jgi:hypothetical protein